MSSFAYWEHGDVESKPATGGRTTGVTITHQIILRELSFRPNIPWEDILYSSFSGSAKILRTQNRQVIHVKYKCKSRLKSKRKHGIADKQSTRNSPDWPDMSGEFWKCPAKEFDLADKMSSKKFDIGHTFHSEMSGENSKCPAKDCRFAGQNVQRGSDEFRVLWIRNIVVMIWLL